jgi:predicted transcriptional regulator
MPYSVLKSPAWRSLSGAAVKVFFELHARFNGSNNGKIHLSMNEAAAALGLGKATVQRVFRELEEKGFIALEAEGNWYHRRAHEWRLTMKPMQTTRGKEVATNDWRQWRSTKPELGACSRNAQLSVNSPRKNGSMKTASRR